MSKIINIQNGYFSSSKNKTIQSLYTNRYSTIKNVKTGEECTVLPLSKTLSFETDIFSSLPESVFSNEHAKIFLLEMKKVLLSIDAKRLQGITLPKLQLTSETDSTLVIEWIFNYFRFFYLFDKNEGDSYGLVMNNIESGEFLNQCNSFNKKSLSNIARDEIFHAITLAEGKI